jgi:hypothetical protein
VKQFQENEVREISAFFCSQIQELRCLFLIQGQMEIIFSKLVDDLLLEAVILL